MVAFNDKAFDEKKVITIVMDSVSKKIRMDLTDNKTLWWGYPTEAKGIKMIADIASLINAREDEILKIKAE